MIYLKRKNKDEYNIKSIKLYVVNDTVNHLFSYTRRAYTNINDLSKRWKMNGYICGYCKEKQDTNCGYIRFIDNTKNLVKICEKCNIKMKDKEPLYLKEYLDKTLKESK
jgi:uncharacterized protein YfbU (UPF0304 family)